MIWLGRAKVAFSIPLTTLSTGMPGGIRSARPLERRPEEGRGDRGDDQVGPAGRVAGVGGDLHALGQADAGQVADVLPRPRQLGRVRGSRAQSCTERTVLLNSTASAVPIPPAPRIATRLMVLAKTSRARWDGRLSLPAPG